MILRILDGRRANGGAPRIGNVGISVEDDASVARLASMVFATESLEKAANLLERRAVPTQKTDGALSLALASTHQVPIALVERTTRRNGKMVMRRLIVAAFLLLGACASQTAPTKTKTIVQASSLAPLAACPSSPWRPEAPPPSPSTKESMVLLALQEWFRFGRQTIDFTQPGDPKIEVLGVQETDAAGRINDYWKSVDQPKLTGLDTEVPWSAAFISWDIASAGVPRDLFCPDARHTIYVERMVLRERRPGAVFIPHRVGERAPRVGDLVCAARDGGGTTLDNLNRGPGHCDIVVEVQAGKMHGIGGNVRDSVTRSIFPLDGRGFLSPIAARPFFTVIENRLP